VQVLDSRRLTGPNLYCDSPGAVLELRFDAGEDPAAFVARWREVLGEALDALGWSAQVHAREFEEGGKRGAELMFSAQVDRLYAATEINEWAVAEASGEGAERSLDEIAAEAEVEQAERRGAVELIAEAEARGVPWLIDDEEFSLGYFDQTLRWSVGALPAPETIEWSELHRRPVALITGTNGKTTTTRLLARIARKAGLQVGNTSTDGLYLDEQLVEAGDWTGPGGARAVLRDPKVELALLEAARGGLLRRGAGVRSCTVALITNVERDHLGEYGIFDVEGMAAAKGIVARIVEPEGKVVLGADSPALVAWARAQELPAAVVWCSIDPQNPVLVEARAAGGELWTIVEGFVCREQGGEQVRLCPARELPLGLCGLARHNLQNALMAAAGARALGLDDAAILAGLREFGATPADNPGRARIWELPRPPHLGGGSVTVFLDFAHNLGGIRAIAELARELARPCTVCFGMAGDRSDADLFELAASLRQFEPRRVILREQPMFARGREPEEVPRLLKQGLLAAGYGAEGVEIVGGEVPSLERALAESEAGEVIFVLVHAEREAVEAWLVQQGATPGQLVRG
jgi:cyanophycin synthetase